MIAALNKLSARERTLALIVGGALILLANLVALKFFFSKSGVLRGGLATQTMNWEAQQELLKQRDFWMQRDTWLRSKQPVLKNAATAGGDLLERVRVLARTHSVALENEKINDPVRGAGHQSVSVLLDATSSWPNLIAFFTALQQPESFIVPESAGVRISPDDNTKMKAQLRIAKWYAL